MTSQGMSAFLWTRKDQLVHRFLHKYNKKRGFCNKPAAEMLEILNNIIISIK